MSGRIHKSRMHALATLDLPAEVREELIRAKQEIRSGGELKAFENKRGGIGDGPPLPQLPNGSIYVERQLGNARPKDSRPAGRRRVVFELQIATRRILEAYYTDEHYAKFSFYRLV